MNLKEEIKSLDLGDMIVTENFLGDFLYGKSDALSRYPDKKKQVDAVMEELGYLARAGRYEKKINPRDIIAHARLFISAGTSKITIEELGDAVFDDAYYLMYDVSPENCRVVIDAMKQAGYKYTFEKDEPCFVREELDVPPAKFDKNKVNPFKDLTDELARTLQLKNEAYGNSFDKTLDKYGLNIAVARIEDKFGRLENIVVHKNADEGDESARDTLMDLAGYAILLVKYMDSKGLNDE